MPEQTELLAKTENLPRPLTPFMDRKAELVGIAMLLVDPACRLLAQVAPGRNCKT